MQTNINSKPFLDQWYSVDILDGAMTSFKFIKKDGKLLLVLFHWLWDMCGVILIEDDEQFTFKIFDHPLYEEPIMLISELSDHDFNRNILEYISPIEYKYFRRLDLNESVQGEHVPYIEIKYKEAEYEEAEWW